MKRVSTYLVCSGLVCCKRQVTEGKCILCTKEHWLCYKGTPPWRLDKHKIMFIYLFSNLYVYYEQGVEPKLNANCKSFKNVFELKPNLEFIFEFSKLKLNSSQVTSPNLHPHPKRDLFVMDTFWALHNSIDCLSSSFRCNMSHQVSAQRYCVVLQTLSGTFLSEAFCICNGLWQNFLVEIVLLHLRTQQQWIKSVLLL